ncbi:trimeric intracellular cation channel family protein [Dactylosporangium sucinum]|nr:trimeric intracellular cation channel family protein [Dactylosporangium sucinum]
MSDTALNALFRGLDLTGVFANAMLGGLMARGERLDPIGFGVLAILSGLGGGLIRDTLLQHGTPVALTDYAYIITALAGAVVAFLLRLEGPLWDRGFLFVDALALGCWASAGAQKTLSVGLGWLPAVLLGTITAVGGGMVRDVVLRRIPGIFGGTTLYATSALFASVVIVVLHHLGMPSIGLVVSTAIGAGLTLLARWRGWRLPEAYTWRPSQIWATYPRPHWRRHNRESDESVQRSDRSPPDTPESP